MRETLFEICRQYEMTLLEQVPLSEHTTFRIGGNADVWVEVSSVPGLQALVQCCKAERIPYFILGKGSNLLVSDAGYRGVILHLGQEFAGYEVLNGGTDLRFGAGMLLVKAAKVAEELALTGMEGLCGIPGTVGGALYMNAGAYGDEMSHIVTGCEYMDPDGGLHTLTAQELALSYRHSCFTELPSIILSVTVALKPGVKAEISARMQELISRRNEKQPLNFPSAGSTFKRPQGSYASMLIDQCGLKGYTVGGAQVSEKHAGFVINRGGATCADVMRLCSDVSRIVQEQTGYLLEMEPIVLGSEGV